MLDASLLAQFYNKVDICNYTAIKQTLSLQMRILRSSCQVVAKEMSRISQGDTHPLILTLGKLGLL